ncbi:hypothetical protein TNCV_1689171 [Trichonephila clavipes]|nr:hypothetical protein TNCV_1689171 [Trichonephila clavipes]
MAQPEGFSDNSVVPIYRKKQVQLYRIVYVDDGIIAADEKQTMNLFLKKLESEFSVVLEAYCGKILSRFDMINSNHVSTPIEKGAITTDDSVSLPAEMYPITKLWHCRCKDPQPSPAWFGCHSKTIALTASHFFKRSLMADVGIGPLVQKETHFAVFLGVLHSKLLGVLLSSVHLHVPL